jgi:hypothetical protein
MHASVRSAGDRARPGQLSPPRGHLRRWLRCVLARHRPASVRSRHGDAVAVRPRQYAPTPTTNAHRVAHPARSRAADHGLFGKGSCPPAIWRKRAGETSLDMPCARAVDGRASRALVANTCADARARASGGGRPDFARGDAQCRACAPAEVQASPALTSVDRGAGVGLVLTCAVARCARSSGGTNQSRSPGASRSTWWCDSRVRPRSVPRFLHATGDVHPMFDGNRPIEQPLDSRWLPAA